MSLRFSSTAAMPDAIRNKVEAQGKGAPREVATKGSKYGNKPTVIDGIRFLSRKEARFYQDLKIRRDTGEVSHWFMQVPIRLPDGTKYVLDFLVFFVDTARQPEYVDVKGRETQIFLMKKKAVEYHYPIRIKLV